MWVLLLAGATVDLFACLAIGSLRAGHGTFVRLRRAEFEQRFPGLLDAVLRLSWIAARQHGRARRRAR